MRAVTVVRAALAAALVGSAVVSPAAGAEGPPALTVEGSRSAFIDFAVADDEQLRFDLDSVQVSGGRTFAVIHISAVGDGPAWTVGAIRAPWLASDVEAFGGTLPPGNYRARLLADGPVKATFPLRQGRPRVLRPHVPLRVRLHRGEQVLAAGRSQALLRLPDAVPARWHALLAYRVTGERAEQTSACVTAASRCPGLPLALPGVADPGVFSGSPSRDTDVRTSSARPADTARDGVVGVDGVRSTPGVVRALVLTFRENPR